MPYLLPALRLAAAAAVIGTVVAEVSIGLRGGIGRLVIEYAQSAGGDPAKPWAPIFGAIAIGLVAAGFVGLIGARPAARTADPRCRRDGGRGPRGSTGSFAAGTAR